MTKTEEKHKSFLNLNLRTKTLLVICIAFLILFSVFVSNYFIDHTAVLTSNFYIYSTGNDTNNLMENDDNIVCFGQNNTPDILFNHLYPNIEVDTYVAGVSDIAPIAMSGQINNESVDYCIIADPVLFNVMNNTKAATYGKGSEYSNFQTNG